MKKAIRILAISAIALAGISAALLFIIFVLQIPICMLYGYETDMFFYPIPYFCNSLGLLLLGTALLLTSKCKIWSDILLLAAQMIVGPIVSLGLSFLDAAILNVMVYSRGSIYVYANSSLIQLCTTPAGLTALGSTVLLIACGMSLAYKCMNTPALKADA